MADATGPRRQAGTPDTAAHDNGPHENDIHGNDPHTALAGPSIVPGIHTHHVRHTHATGHPSQSLHLAHPGPSTPSGPTASGRPPGGRPGGALGNRSLADSGSSRHGDAHAVTPGLRAPLALAAGLVTRTDRAGTRGELRGVPLFPG
ncbi:hypothetical protein [Streptomyces luteogriseus]|uniref:hypothetical protein n=1 Tax=Streptomyces luteogriseus TaxID=68233 RepID=UPI0036895290